MSFGQGYAVLIVLRGRKDVGIRKADGKTRGNSPDLHHGEKEMSQVATAVATVLEEYRQPWLYWGQAESKSYTRVIRFISSWICPIGGLSNAAPANAKSRREPRYVRRQGLAAQDEIRQPRRVVFEELSSRVSTSARWWRKGRREAPSRPDNAPRSDGRRGGVIRAAK